jgi:NIMA (never in mitosis gene a)-related kinase
MRPSCEGILEMQIVRKRIEKLFPNDEFYESQSSLLNTIRVPKNLLYLTDRLPKPSYESPTQKKWIDDEERLRRKTHDAGGMLPDIKTTNQRKSHKVND